MAIVYSSASLCSLRHHHHPPPTHNPRLLATAAIHMDLDKPLDEIIKQNKVQKKVQKKPNPNQNGNGNSNSNGNNSKSNNVNGHSGGPIRTRNATKRITKQKASPYAVCLASSVTSSDAPLYCSRKIVRPRSAFVNEIAELVDF